MLYLLNSCQQLQLGEHLFHALPTQPSEGSPQAGHCHHCRAGVAEDVLGGRQRYEGLGVLADGVDVERGVQVQGPEQVVHDGVGGHSREVPFQNLKYQHFPLLKKEGDKRGKIKAWDFRRHRFRLSFLSHASQYG